MRALDRKLLRDLWRLRGQVIAIAMVVASGVAVLVMSLSTIEALENTAEAYYERNHFAHVFAGVKRAPVHIANRLARIPGVQTIETRIAKFATLDIKGFAEPVTGRLVSIPERAEPILNRLVIRTGRTVRLVQPDEVVLSEPFAEAHGLRPGDRLKAIMNGNKRTLRVVGIALSPEYVYAIGPGSLMPDKKRFGVLWMGRKALAAAYDLDGAFNDVSLTLRRGTDPRDVIDRMDRTLDRFGGVGAYSRKDQISNWFLMNEIKQLRTTATILPVIFLAVAAFLVNMVLGRLISTERSEIGLLKAFGYRNAEVGWHYAKMVMVIAGIGIILGWALGAGLGRFNTQVYGELYRFPFLLYRPSPSAFIIAGLVSLAAALMGTIGAVRTAVILPPAVALQPPTPPMYRRGVMSTRPGRSLDQSTRIILRQIVRWPKRSLLTTVGIAMTVGVLITALQWLDAIDHLVTNFFFEAQHQTMTVGLVDARSSTALHEFEHMPGVLSAEPMRIVSARFRAGFRTHRGTLEGITPESRLKPVHDVGGKIVRVPPAGIVMSTKLAEKLGIRRGDLVAVKLLEGHRPVREIPVVDLFETYIGTPAYMDLSALNRLLREPPSIGYALLLIDESKKTTLFAHLKELPSVTAVMLRRAAVATFHETMGETLMVFVSFFIGFACTLAVGVVYNSARISLSEQGRELATLRVLGFSRGEISYILLGEIALLIFVGLPMGCLVGYGLSWMMMLAFETELFRVPFIIEASTYGMSVLIALAATILSMALVRRRLDRLDLIAVLKTRE
jgi:putative ABC transport system permease protein